MPGTGWVGGWGMVHETMKKLIFINHPDCRIIVENKIICGRGEDVELLQHTCLS